MRSCLFLLSCLVVLAINIAAHAFTISVTQNIALGTVEYETGAKGQVQLGTNGSVNTTGSGLTQFGAAQPGIVTITGGSSQEIVEIRCQKSVKMASDQSSTTLTFNKGEAVMDTGVSFGSATLCNGSGNNKTPVFTVTVNAGQSRNILIGGKVTINTNSKALLPSETFNSTFSGGTFLRVKVTIQ